MVMIKGRRPADWRVERENCSEATKISDEENPTVQTSVIGFGAEMVTKAGAPLISLRRTLMLTDDGSKSRGGL